MIGYRSSVSKGIRWRDNQGGLLPLSPPFTLSGLNESDASQIMADYDSLFLRWESEFDQGSDGVWWHIVKDTPDPLEGLPKKTRYMVRKASREYEARPVSVNDILKDGYNVYRSAYQRYDTHEPMFNHDEFCEALLSLPDETEFWGVYEIESKRLVAFSENYIEHDTCFYVTMWSDPKALAKFASYLLFHEMELHYLRDRCFKYVSDGARSLSHETNIHEFLIRKFKFRKAYARLNIVYVPWLGIAVSMAYPFRHWIEKIPFGPFKKASILLRQEDIRRQCREASA